MGLCPYCNHEIHLADFFDIKKEKRKKDGTLSIQGELKGEQILYYSARPRGSVKTRMYVCPACNKILGFSG